VAIDERGSTYELHKGEAIIQSTRCKRDAGSTGGSHFHKGDDDSKSPEKLYIDLGECLFWAKNGLTGDSIERDLGADTEIRIAPGILHGFYFKTDTLLTEWRCTEFDRNNSDTYSADEYDGYVAEMRRKI